ncbi:flavodoxin family protein [Bifidobacterium psychraerophilum]|uniref:flavodoxin family protein n=1 Tax=Bifidobacterium psychraerophilum TaxID=218140 RepID=UPI0039E91937
MNEAETKLFLNASSTPGGNTARLAHLFYGGEPYSTLNLVDYRIDQLGQKSEGDQYDQVERTIGKASFIAIGTPVYWSDMTGLLKTWIDRHEHVDNRYAGIGLVALVQGSAPEDAIGSINHVFDHFAQRFSLDYHGVRTFDNASRLDYQNLM